MEPGRQSGAAEDFNTKFVEQGRQMFQPTGDNLQALNCAGCHGASGVGGSAVYNITQPDGSIKVVNWKAPALNTVLLRYSRDEVTFILTYGRPFSPMPAWGLTGGGPLNDQQIQNLIDYLETIQITPDQAQQEARDGLTKMMAVKNADGTPMYASEGEALFNMGLGADVAGGAFSCGRCHTQGWSYATSFQDVQAQSGCGALGPSLCGGAVIAQFPAKPVAYPCKANVDAPGDDPVCANPVQDQIDFVTDGSELGKKYGVHGQGSGKMPGFGQRPAEPALFWINKGKPRDPSPGMLPPDLIEKIVDYERTR
jgi:cytochrome c553